MNDFFLEIFDVINRGLSTHKFSAYVRLKSLFVHTHKGVAVLFNLLSVLFEDSRIVGCGLSLL
jgi:hypothetical protein